MAYGQSKTASSLIAIEFNEKMKNYGWVCCSSRWNNYPPSIMQEDGSPTELAKNFFKTTNQGSSTTLWCATNEKLNGIGGVFCEDCDKRKKSYARFWCC